MKKKLLAAILAMCFVFSFTQAAAASTAEVVVAEPMPPGGGSASFDPGVVKVDEKALEEAIIAVKNRVNIPKDYTVFDFSHYVQYGQTVFDLRWSVEDFKNRYATISVNYAGGIITNFHTYDSEKNRGGMTPKFAALSNKQLFDKATAALKKLNPSIAAKIEIDRDSFNSYVNHDGASFSLYRLENGVKVANNDGYINLNKDTGELQSFYISWVDGVKFDNNQGALTQAQIKESYAKLVKLTPVYRTTYDYQKDTQDIILVYLADENPFLDAFTGKKSDFMNNFYGGYYDGGAKGALAAEVAEDVAYINAPATNPMTGGGGREMLTTAEQTAIEKEKGLISLKQAASVIINDKFNAFPADSEVRSANLNQYKEDGDYFWNINFVNGYASVNAKTSAIENFYFYENYESVTRINAATFDKNVSDALKVYMGSKLSQYKLESAETSSYSYGKNEQTQIYGRYYNYTRYVNDIKVESDNIWVNTDAKGLITSFNYNFSDVKFPSAANMLKQDAAITKLFTQQDLELAYYINVTPNDGSVKTALLYTMPYFTLNALTGDLVGWNGEVITPGGGYSDIENHSIKLFAQKLMENGIMLPAIDGKLMPDERISEADFINLVGGVSSDWETFYYDYQMRVYNSKTKDSITRREGVKCFIDALGGKKFAELKGIYASPFADIGANDKDLGYFAIANSMGIAAAGSKGGNISPDATLTRAQALRMIYGYLDKNSD